MSTSLVNTSTMTMLMDFYVYVVVVIEFTEKRLPTGSFIDLFMIRSNWTLNRTT